MTFAQLFCELFHLLINTVMIEVEEAQVCSHQIWRRTYDLSLLLNTECSSFMYIKGFINNAFLDAHTRACKYL